jgi:SAM-dependent methyltransferase
LAPEYPEILDRLKAGEKFLDVGCCFGQILRQLVFDGVPAQNLAGTDLRPEFVELGYELFKDKDRLEAQFVTGDALDANNKSLEILDGKFNIIHAASFFHLFGWDDQVKIGERIVKFFRPDANALVLGRQSGNWQPVSLELYRASGEKRYHHNVETFQALWDEIGERTGTKWKVTGGLFDISFDEGFNGIRTVLKFAVRKVV